MVVATKPRKTARPKPSALQSPPRVKCWPRVRTSRGDLVVDLMGKLGVELDAHQRFVLSKALGVRRGRWAAFEVGIMEPRQNGKGVILAAIELAGLFLFGEELIIHSAHEFATSQEHFRRIEALLRQYPDFDDQVASYRHSHGEEQVELVDGRRLQFRTRTKGGALGFSCDRLMLDEAQILKADALAAMMPTLRARARSTKHGVQVVYAGSAVDWTRHEHGSVWGRIRDRGIAGADPDLAYFEWSLDLESPLDLTDEMMFDEALRKATNPAYGERIDREHFDRECRTLDRRYVATELFGVGDWRMPDALAQGPFTIDEWLALTDETSVLEDPVCLAFDVSPDRGAAIAAAGKNVAGRPHMEIADARPRTGWIRRRLIEMNEAHSVEAIVYAAHSPAASLARDLEEEGLPLVEVTVDEHAKACGRLVDLVQERGLVHLGTDDVQNAIRGASTRPYGDAWLWSRKSSQVDISPLVAATLAVDAAAAMQPGGDWIVA